MRKAMDVKGNMNCGEFGDGKKEIEVDPKVTFDDYCTW